VNGNQIELPQRIIFIVCHTLLGLYVQNFQDMFPSPEKVFCFAVIVFFHFCYCLLTVSRE